MNERHLRGLASPEWAAALRDDLLPWLTATVNLGDDVLEIGPGPGLTTDLLRELTANLTALEADPGLAAALAARLEGTGVDVRHGSGNDTGFPANRFTTVACFAVLHHIPTAAAQDAVFAEAFRLLRPGGAFAGTDPYDDADTRAHHVNDTFVPSDPDKLPARLEAAGFRDIIIERGGYDYRFAARKPAA